MVGLLRVLLLRTAIIAVSSACFYLVLANIHDYPQTKQALAGYRNGDRVFFLIAFNFVNEAGNGIRHALTGNSRHLGYFPKSGPRQDGSERELTHSSFEVALVGAQAGDWREQLRLSHMYAIGWGTDMRGADALEWYRKSETAADEQNEHDMWLSSSRRQLVAAIINTEFDYEKL